MPFGDFVEFMLFEGIEPFGIRGDYLRTGIECSTMANIHRSAGTKQYRPSDFMPSFDPPREQTQAEIYEMMKMFMAATQKEMN